MNAVQINKSRMYMATNQVLETNQASYAGMEELVVAVQQLKGYNEVLTEYRQIQELNQTGLTSNKLLLKEKLTTQLLKVVSALTAHATATKDAVLLSRVSYRPSALLKPDPVLADIALLIYNEGMRVGEPLGKYFVTEEDLAVLDSLILQFKESIPQKRVATNVSKVSTMNIAAVFAATDKLLKTEIDLLMLPFQFNNPDFYNAYKNARIIVNYSGRGKGTDEPPQPDAD